MEAILKIHRTVRRVLCTLAAVGFCVPAMAQVEGGPILQHPDGAGNLHILVGSGLPVARHRERRAAGGGDLVGDELDFPRRLGHHRRYRARGVAARDGAERAALDEIQN